MMATQSLWSKAIKPEHEWHSGNLETRFPMSARQRAKYLQTSRQQLEHWRRERVGNAFHGSIAVDSQPLLVHQVSADWISYTRRRGRPVRHLATNLCIMRTLRYPLYATSSFG